MVDFQDREDFGFPFSFNGRWRGLRLELVSVSIGELMVHVPRWVYRSMKCRLRQNRYDVGTSAKVMCGGSKLPLNARWYTVTAIAVQEDAKERTQKIHPSLGV